MEFYPQPGESALAHCQRLSASDQDSLASAVRDDATLFGLTADSRAFMAAASALPSALGNATEARAQCNDDECRTVFDNTSVQLCEGDTRCLASLPPPGAGTRSSSRDSASAKLGRALALAGPAPHGIRHGVVQRTGVQG